MSGSASRIWIALFVALVFVCGLSIGLAVTAWRGPGPGFDGMRGPFRRGGGPGGPGGPRGFVAERILDRLESDPDFTDEQRSRLETLFQERETRFREFNREMRQRFEAEQASLHDEIAAVLTPSQMAIFGEARRAQRRWRGPGRPGDPERRMNGGPEPRP